MPYTVAEAAKAIGKSKATVFRAIAKGTISARRDDTTGAFQIEPAELHRVFPPLSEASHEAPHDTGDGTPRNTEWNELRARLEAAELRLADKDAMIAAHEATIADLRHRFDIGTQQLGEALQQVRLLTDQRATPPPPRRSWLPWRRG